MADISITASAVIPVDGYSYVDVKAAATITQGQVCYLNTSNAAALAQCDGTALEATIGGIALNSALTGQPIRLLTGGDLGFGVVFTAGTVYAVSASAGNIAPSSDLASTNKVSYLGVATTTANLRVVINNTGVTKA